MRLHKKDIVALEKAVESGELARIPVPEMQSKYNSNDKKRDLCFFKSLLLFGKWGKVWRRYSANNRRIVLQIEATKGRFRAALLCCH